MRRFVMMLAMLTVLAAGCVRVQGPVESFTCEVAEEEGGGSP